MRSSVSSSVVALAALLALAAPPALAQRDPDAWLRDCRESSRWDRGERFCEVRERTLRPTGSAIRVDGGANGGVSVYGWDKNEILVRALVQVNSDRDDRDARDPRDPRDIAREIEISTDGATIRAEGPRTRRGWAVSFLVFVPRRADLDLRANNGGIHIADVSGRIEFTTTNGGVSLTNLGGRVRGDTHNGGVTVTLAGRSWDGDGIDVETRNGGVHLLVPDGYSAHLETGTINGGMNIDFPITVQGRLGRRISTDLGRGGATVRVMTSNGGVTVRRA